MYPLVNTRATKKSATRHHRIDVVKIMKLAVAQNGFIGSCRINQILLTFHHDYGLVPEGFMGIYAHGIDLIYYPHTAPKVLPVYAFICVYIGAVII